MSDEYVDMIPERVTSNRIHNGLPPSSTLPKSWSDEELCHIIEDGALWAFVAFAYLYARSDGQQVHDEAERFLSWFQKNSNRTRWYA